VFSTLNFEECSFLLSESVLTLSGYQAEGPDFLFLLDFYAPLQFAKAPQHSKDAQGNSRESRRQKGRRLARAR
jgi:hypothetical protein